MSEYNDFIDLSYLQRIGKNDPRFILQMLQSFASTNQLIREGLSSALKDRDHQALAEELHKLVFALGVIGAKHALTQVRGLEERVKNREIDHQELKKACIQLDQALELLSQEAHTRSNELNELI
ncbi:MAG: Hpt domain-containing protein [Chitinophagaceae bacterium]|nr:Hpt domain-containing protein [Chitinophagaceae bacterium]